MGILAEPIKRDFSLSDSQLGILTGIGFSLFFAVGGLPIGLLVDRTRRTVVLAASVLVFSGMTALGAVTTSFAQILATRSLVGAGEAGGTPAMGSMLADLFPAERRAQAMAIFYAGAPIGAILAFLVGGAFASHYGWRATLLLAGLPGVLLALILAIAVREPDRGAGVNREEGARAPGLGETLRFVASRSSLRHILFTPVVTSAASAGVFNFLAPFLIRTRHLALAQAGVIVAVFYGALGAAATLACGPLVDRLARLDRRWPTWFCGLANLLAALAMPVMTLAPNLLLSLAGLGLFAIATTATYGPLLAMVQSLVAPRMRGVATAVLYLNSYLLGAGTGPYVVGRISDHLRPSLGAGSLRYAILFMGMLYAWGALHFLMASRRYRQDLAAAAAL